MHERNVLVTLLSLIRVLILLFSRRAGGGGVLLWRIAPGCWGVVNYEDTVGEGITDYAFGRTS